jgi:uncharacterized membrane protein
MVIWHDEVFSVACVLGYGAGEAHDALYNAGHVLRPKDLQRFQTADPSRTWADTWRALQGHPEHGPLYYLLARIGSGPTEPAVVGLRGTSAALSLLLLPAMAWLAPVRIATRFCALFNKSFDWGSMRLRYFDVDKRIAHLFSSTPINISATAK